MRCHQFRKREFGWRVVMAIANAPTNPARAVDYQQMPARAIAFGHMTPANQFARIDGPVFEIDGAAKCLSLREIVFVTFPVAIHLLLVQQTGHSGSGRSE